MDPVSIAASCLSIAGGVVKLTKELTVFALTFRDAREDVAGVAGQLTQLKMTLDLLANDSHGIDDVLPTGLKDQIKSSLSGCGVVLTKLEDVLAKYRGKSASIKWALWGKDKVTDLSTQLSVHTAALNVALELSTLTLARRLHGGMETLNSITNNIDLRTVTIQANTSSARLDIARVLTEIEILRDLVRDSLAAGMPSSQRRTMDWVEQYADSASSYAEQVCDDVGLEALTINSESPEPGKSPQRNPEPAAGTSDLSSTSSASTEQLAAPQPVTHALVEDADSRSKLRSLLASKVTPGPNDHSSETTLAFEVMGRSAAFVPWDANDQSSQILAIVGADYVVFHDIPSGEIVSFTAVHDQLGGQVSIAPQFSPDGRFFALIPDGHGHAVYLNDTPRYEYLASDWCDGVSEGLQNSQVYEVDNMTPRFVAFSMDNLMMFVASITGAVAVFTRKSEREQFKRQDTFGLHDMMPSGATLTGLAIDVSNEYFAFTLEKTSFPSTPQSTKQQKHSLHVIKFPREGDAVTSYGSPSKDPCRFHYWPTYWPADKRRLTMSHWMLPTAPGYSTLSLVRVKNGELDSSSVLFPRELDEYLYRPARNELDNYAINVGCTMYSCCALCRSGNENADAGYIEIWDGYSGKRGTVGGLEGGKQLTCPDFSPCSGFLLARVADSEEAAGIERRFQLWSVPRRRKN